MLCGVAVRPIPQNEPHYLRVDENFLRHVVVFTLWMANTYVKCNLKVATWNTGMFYTHLPNQAIQHRSK